MLSFMKVPPSTYVLQYKHGKIKREGAGLSFIYYAPTSTIVAIPMASADVPFVFQESTADFQSVTIQGQLTYRVADPKRLASLLDFSVDKRRAYYSEDPRKLPERLIHTQEEQQPAPMFQGMPQNAQEMSSIVRCDEGNPEVADSPRQSNDRKKSSSWVVGDSGGSEEHAGWSRQRDGGRSS